MKSTTGCLWLSLWWSTKRRSDTRERQVSSEVTAIQFVRLLFTRLPFVANCVKSDITHEIEFLDYSMSFVSFGHFCRAFHSHKTRNTFQHYLKMCCKIFCRQTIVRFAQQNDISFTASNTLSLENISYHYFLFKYLFRSTQLLCIGFRFTDIQLLLWFLVYTDLCISNEFPFYQKSHRVLQIK